MKISFDLSMSRLDFFKYGMKMIWAAITGIERVMFTDADCGELTSDGKVWR